MRPTPKDVFILLHSFNENYYKLLEDFTTMVDGQFYPQGAVKAVFPGENSAFGSMKALISEGLSEDNIQEGNRSEKVGDIVDEVVKMLSGETDTTVKRSKDVESAKITPTMSDAERANIISDKSIKAPVYTGQAEMSISQNKEKLESEKISLVKAALTKIGEEFGVFGHYNIKDVNVEASFSKGNIKESVSQKSDAELLARLMPIFRIAVENSVGIEAHDNRYYYDNKTVLFENLLGGYMDGDMFVPVRFVLKHIDTGEAI